jgi:hypothetical protein
MKGTRAVGDTGFGRLSYCTMVQCSGWKSPIPHTRFHSHEGDLCGVHIHNNMQSRHRSTSNQTTNTRPGCPRAVGFLGAWAAPRWVCPAPTRGQSPRCRAGGKAICNPLARSSQGLRSPTSNGKPTVWTVGCALYSPLQRAKALRFAGQVAVPSFDQHLWGGETAGSRTRTAVCPVAV